MCYNDHNNARAEQFGIRTYVATRRQFPPRSLLAMLSDTYIYLPKQASCACRKTESTNIRIIIFEEGSQVVSPAPDPVRVCCRLNIFGQRRSKRKKVAELERSERYRDSDQIIHSNTEFDPLRRCRPS